MHLIYLGGNTMVTGVIGEISDKSNHCFGSSIINSMYFLLVKFTQDGKTEREHNK